MALPFRDEGIVLRRVDYAEADRVLTLLTEGHGKVGAIARGVRRPRSRLGPALDLFSRCALQLATGRGSLLVVTQAERLSPPWPGRELTRTACAAVVVGVADAVLEEAHPQPVLYGMVASTLGRIGDAGRDARAELAWFAFTAADEVGYRPVVDRCAACGGVLVDADAAFAPARGGVVQGGCAAADPAALACHAPTLRLLRRMAAGERDLFDRVRWTPGLREELEALLVAHLTHHLDHPLRAASLLRGLRPAG